MHIVIAKVDQNLFDGEAESLTVPGSAGEMTVLGEHMPLVTTLKPGTITVRAGEYVTAGQALFPEINTGDTWIEANLKETQLTHIQVGQRATIIADAYPDLVWRARVTSIMSSARRSWSAVGVQRIRMSIVAVIPVSTTSRTVNGYCSRCRGFTCPIE